MPRAKGGRLSYAPERLLKPLASAVAYEVFGASSRWSEELPRVEAALNGGGVA